jgi:hypothetical protein
MHYHEREFFISLIRTGKVYIDYADLELIIMPPTLEQNIRACQVYEKMYEQCYVDGLMNEEETLLWMIEQGIWDYDDDEKIKGLEKDLERLKIEIYEARNNEQLKERIRLYIRAGEKQLAQQLSKKTQFFSNTCEGISTAEKTSYLIKNTTYLNDRLYDFDEGSLHVVVSEWHDSFLTEKQCRELARTEPWKSLWVISEKSGIELFQNAKTHDLTYNQKNIVIWAQMYDNIQESLDCPASDVINDDDMLDGWFIIQGKKREKEKAEQEFENSVKSGKIKNASEVFVVANSKKDKDRVESMNNVHGSNIKRQRDALIKQRGSVEQQQFLDEKLRIQSEATNMYKGTVKGGR